MRLLHAITKRLEKLPWWVYLVLGNSVFITLSIIFYYLPDFSYKWILFNPFNLGFEMNLATWWSSMLLLALALIAYELANTKPTHRNIWMILAVLFALLSFDELGSLHERLANLAGDIAYLPLALAGGILLFFVLFRIWRDLNMNSTAILLLIGFVLMASAAPLEYLEHRVEWPAALLGLRLGFEEGIELAGMFFCFAALIPQRQLTTIGGACLVPDPNRMPQNGRLPWLVLGTQVIITALVVNFVEISFRGNPSIWIPSSLFFFLFSLTFWYWWETSHKTRTAWGLIALLSLFLSIASLYTLSPRVSNRLDSLAAFSFLALASLFLYLAGWFWCRNADSDSLSWWYLGFITVIIMVAFSHMTPLMYIMATLFALAIVKQFRVLSPAPVKTIQVEAKTAKEN